MTFDLLTLAGIITDIAIFAFVMIVAMPGIRLQRMKKFQSTVKTGRNDEKTD